jgi:hypothetical protein
MRQSLPVTLTFVLLVAGCRPEILPQKNQEPAYDPSAQAAPMIVGVPVSDFIGKGDKRNYQLDLTPGSSYSVLCMRLTAVPFELSVYEEGLSRISTFTNSLVANPRAYTFFATTNRQYLTLDATNIDQSSTSYTVGVVANPTMSTPITEGAWGAEINIAVDTIYFGQVAPRGASYYDTDVLDAGIAHTVSACTFVDRPGSWPCFIELMLPSPGGDYDTERTFSYSTPLVYFDIHGGPVNRDGAYFFLYVH